MDIKEAIKRVMEDNESLWKIKDHKCEEILEERIESTVDEVGEEEMSEFWGEADLDAISFVEDVIVELESHSDNERALQVIKDFAQQYYSFQAYDTLITSFDFPEKEQFISRGKKAFVKELTEHW